MAFSASSPAELPLSVPRALPAAEPATRGISVSALVSFAAGALTTAMLAFAAFYSWETPTGAFGLAR